ncbi:DUF6252 family protein [Avrilella dinanensis]|uniref:DUF6252 family protein n=1 Tax=Avrilella dinanensis TaxID=2008672 RepID=UPI002409DF98|nr:DUF6252 family protein [Avrilella dinanensis]
MHKTLLLLLSSLFLFACCKSDDDIPTPDPNIPEIEKLPPATQTGANTVGCLVNGMAFLPSGLLPVGGNSNPYCGYYHDSFVLSFSIIKHENNTTAHGSESIAIYSSDTVLEQGGTYYLKDLDSSQTAAYKIVLSPSITYETNNEYTGELHITKLDKDNNIISGTFWFNAINEQGEVVEIREGRFDMVFDGWAG